jgi:hypothetical protein
MRIGAYAFMGWIGRADKAYEIAYGIVEGMFAMQKLN